MKSTLNLKAVPYLICLSKKELTVRVNIDALLGASLLKERERKKILYSCLKQDSRLNSGINRIMAIIVKIRENQCELHERL